MAQLEESIVARYLSGRLSPGEMAEFEKRLAAEPEIWNEIRADQSFQNAADRALSTLVSEGGSSLLGLPPVPNLNESTNASTQRRMNGMDSGSRSRFSWPRIEESPIRRHTLVESLKVADKDGATPRSVAASIALHMLALFGLAMITFGNSGGKPIRAVPNQPIRITFLPPPDNPKALSQTKTQLVEQKQPPAVQPQQPKQTPPPPTPRVKPPTPVLAVRPTTKPQEQPTFTTPRVTETPKNRVQPAPKTPTPTPTPAPTPTPTPTPAPAPTPTSQPTPTPRRAAALPTENNNAPVTEAPSIKTASTAQKAQGSPDLTPTPATTSSPSGGQAAAPAAAPAATAVARAVQGSESSPAFSAGAPESGASSSQPAQPKSNPLPSTSGAEPGPQGMQINGASSAANASGSMTGLGIPRETVGEPGGRGRPNQASGAGPRPTMMAMSTGSSTQSPGGLGLAAPGEMNAGGPRAHTFGTMPQAGSADKGIAGAVSLPGRNGPASQLPTEGGSFGIAKLTGSGSKVSTYGRRQIGGSGQVVAVAPRTGAGEGGGFGTVFVGGSQTGVGHGTSPSGGRVPFGAFGITSGNDQAAGPGGAAGPGFFGRGNGQMRASGRGAANLPVGPVHGEGRVYGGPRGGNGSAPTYTAGVATGSGEGGSVFSPGGAFVSGGTGTGHSRGPRARRGGMGIGGSFGSGSVAIAMNARGRGSAAASGGSGSAFAPVFSAGGGTAQYGASGGRGSAPHAAGIAGAGGGVGQGFGLGLALPAGESRRPGGPRGRSGGRGLYGGGEGAGAGDVGMAMGGRGTAAGGDSGYSPTFAGGGGSGSAARGGRGGSSGGFGGPAAGAYAGGGGGGSDLGSGGGFQSGTGSGVGRSGPGGRGSSDVDVADVGSGGPGAAGFDASAGVLKRTNGSTGIYDDLTGDYLMPGAITTGDYNWHINDLAKLLAEISNRTNVKVRLEQQYIDPARQGIKNAPLIVFTGHQAFSLTPAQRDALKTYVENGGMIWGDYAHSAFDQSFRREMSQIFGPPQQLSTNHEIFRSKYQMDRVPAGDLGETRPFEGIYVQGTNRLAVVITPNRYFGSLDGPPHVTESVYEDAVKVGVNIYLYAVHGYQSINGQ